MDVIELANLHTHCSWKISKAIKEAIVVIDTCYGDLKTGNINESESYKAIMVYCRNYLANKGLNIRYSSATFSYKKLSLILKFDILN
jgi:hypothetical protein